jgi:hypothetical protein
MAATLLAILGVLTLAYVLVRFYPDATARWVDTITTITGGFWALVVVIVALTLIGSGSALLVLVGAGMLLLVILTAVFQVDIARYNPL